MNEGKTTCGKPSRGRYTMGCRCYMCRVANAEYEQKRLCEPKRKSSMVGAQSVIKARKRVQGWLDDGYTLREICRATGVNRNAMRTLISGKHHHARTKKNGKPYTSKRMSRKNYDAIMGCKKIVAPRGCQLVDAASVNKALAYLYARGVRPCQVAELSGIPDGTIRSLGKREKCTYKTLARIYMAAEELKAVAG